MLRIACEQRQLDARIADGDAGRLPLVLHLHDVHPFPGEQVEQLRELARPVEYPRAYDEIAPGERQPAPHHLHHERGVDVAPREQREHRSGAAAHQPLEDRGCAGGAGALDHELRPLGEEDDRLRDLLVVDRDDVVERLAEDPHRHLAWLLDRDPVSDRVAGPARPRARRLYADKPQPRPHRAQRDGDA